MSSTMEIIFFGTTNLWLTMRSLGTMHSVGWKTY